MFKQLFALENIFYVETWRPFCIYSKEKKTPRVFDALKYLNWNITEKYY